MSGLEERRISFRSDGLRLEGAIHDGAAALAAVVLHPHPQYGGDMDNHVVLAICAALAARGATTLRFNFRGAGRSEGRFDNGRGEAADARAGVAVARTAAPGVPLVLAGYSFGAMIAGAIAGEARPSMLVLVSPLVGMAGLPPLDPALPTLVIAGDRDEIAPATAVRALASGETEAVVVAGIDHGWWPGLDALSSEIDRFVNSRTPGMGVTP